MNLIEKKPKQALIKAYLKVKILRSNIELFKEQLALLFEHSDELETEEFHKNIVSEFLNRTYYHSKFYINTKGRNDLVIHNGKESSTTVGVIIEAKRPSNKHEMPNRNNINVKAFHELLLYYLRERISNNNLELKHLIATNTLEWFVFDANVFEKAFARNKTLIKQFNDFEAGRLSGTTTDFFYREIAAPAIAATETEIVFTRFDFRDYKNFLSGKNRENEKQLISLYKLLSPEHLLKLPFVNDSNTLDRKFYNELLYIIGLQEVKSGSKKLIGRYPEGKQNKGSLIENTILQLNSLDKINRLTNPLQYGKNYEERLFNVSLQLVITWINRILFLKLLEAQLIKYHGGDLSYSFLTNQKITDFDELNGLFFQVLAFRENEREEEALKLFPHVPYLNSSLFEPTSLEHETFFINNLSNTKTLSIFTSTVLKDTRGKKQKGELKTLEYIFSFLDAYDFAGEGSEDIQDDNKSLINASVLGLIFEKINGYKEGSFFTPGFITMYMSRESIRRAVVQKFNDVKNWKCNNLDDVYNNIDDRLEANQIINDLKIIDPAVGSGHFLVSALNEIIAIKSDLHVLLDRDGRRMKEYSVEVVNDELVVTDEDGELFEYNFNIKESRRVQETLFHEKQTIIEHCLFGVDINPNSVNICRLRLWIELLKNAYYKSDGRLETLPNLDINIKKGNSLISRFDLNADLGDALKRSKWNIDSYRVAVDTYRNAKNKEQKHEMERLIQTIKSDFRSEINRNDPKLKRLSRLKGELITLTTQTSLFEITGKEKKAWNTKVEKLSKAITKIEEELETIKHNQIYNNAFEWRFEFPEVLNNNGDFVGFDVVIGNPPYIRQEEFSEIKAYLKFHYRIYHSVADLLTYFVEKGYQLLKPNGTFSFIISNKFTRTNYGKVMRAFLLSNINLTHFIDFSGLAVFDEATVDAAILGFEKNANRNTSFLYADIDKKAFDQFGFEQTLNMYGRRFKQSGLDENSWAFESDEVLKIKHKVEQQGIPLKDWDITINYGIKTGYNKAFVIDGEKKAEFIAHDPHCAEILKPLLRGRDIKKYHPDFQDLWLINTHNGYMKEGEKVPPISINDYPIIKEHLNLYYEKIIKRTDKGFSMFNLRNCAYINDFSKPKIIYPNMTKYLPFVIDLEEHYYHNDKSFHLITDSIYWLGAFLNSKLFKYCFRDNFAELLGGTRELRKVFFEPIPVKQISEEEEKPFELILNKILSLKKQNPAADTTALEKEIDQMVYQLYGLTDEEIEIVEKSEQN